MSSYCWFRTGERIGPADRGAIVQYTFRRPILISAVGLDRVLVLEKERGGEISEQVCMRDMDFLRMVSADEGGVPCTSDEIAIAEELTNYYRKRI